MKRKQQSKPIDIYIHTDSDKNETLFSGITFKDFIACVPTPVENILLLKSCYFAKKNRFGFELLEGKAEISELLREDIHSYGDFSFVDYADTDSAERLSKENIAELLYVAHTLESLKTPFLDALQNNFVYLSHDDGWYCKLYCKEPQIPISILINKIQNCIKSTMSKNEYTLPKNLVEAIQNLSPKGLLVSLDLSTQKQNKCNIKLYNVGKYENPDTLFNTLEINTLPISFEFPL